MGGTQARQFFLSHRSDRWAMRWVVLDSADTKSILRLAVKYQLHPLYIEDVIKLEVRPRMLEDIPSSINTQDPFSRGSA